MKSIFFLALESMALNTLRPNSHPSRLLAPSPPLLHATRGLNAQEDALVWDPQQGGADMTAERRAEVGERRLAPPASLRSSSSSASLRSQNSKVNARGPLNARGPPVDSASLRSSSSSASLRSQQPSSSSSASLRSQQPPKVTSRGPVDKKKAHRPVRISSTSSLNTSSGPNRGRAPPVQTGTAHVTPHGVMEHQTGRKGRATPHTKASSSSKPANTAEAEFMLGAEKRVAAAEKRVAADVKAVRAEMDRSRLAQQEREEEQARRIQARRIWETETDEGRAFMAEWNKEKKKEKAEWKAMFDRLIETDQQRWEREIAEKRAKAMGWSSPM